MSDILVGRCRGRDGLVFVPAHFRLLFAAGAVGCAPRNENILRFKLAEGKKEEKSSFSIEQPLIL